MTLKDRFWAKVQRGDGCWLWTASTNKLGYGNFSSEGRQTKLAHRVAWEIECGPIPDGMKVCHRCDVPSCVRVSHLFLGTQKDNVQDQIKKRRRHVTLGVANGRAKIKPQAVHEIRSMFDAGGVSQTTLAAKFSIGRSQIGNIVRRREWREMPA